MIIEYFFGQELRDTQDSWLTLSVMVGLFCLTLDPERFLGQLSQSPKLSGGREKCVVGTDAGLLNGSGRVLPWSRLINGWRWRVRSKGCTDDDQAVAALTRWHRSRILVVFVSKTDGDYMKRINNIEKTVRLFNHNITFSDHRQFQMRHRILIAIGGSDEERSPAGKLLSNNLGGSSFRL